MQWAVDRYNITLGQHLLEALDTPASDILLNLGLEWLVVEVQQFLAVKGLQSSQHTLANTTNSNGTNDLVLKIIFILGSSRDVPFTGLDLLMCWDEVSDEIKDGHDDVFGDRDDVGTSDFGDGDTTISCVGGIKIDVVRPDTGCDCKLELLCLCESLSGQVTRMEAVQLQLVSQSLPDDRGLAFNPIAFFCCDPGSNRLTVL